MQRHEQLFAEGLGTVEPCKVSLQVQYGAKPRFFKYRPVPFAVRDAVGKELDWLEQQGIPQKVCNSDWAAPVVAVPKKDGRFRIYGDYKVTINQVLSVEQYPFATLAKRKVFSMLDLWWVVCDTSKRENIFHVRSLSGIYTVTARWRFNNLRHYQHPPTQGLYSFTRLPFGVASTPATLQKDDGHSFAGFTRRLVLYWGHTGEWQRRSKPFQAVGGSEVFSRLEKHGYRPKQEKCRFLLLTVEYLGRQISSDGVRPLPTKIEPILKAPVPGNIQKFRSFHSNYYYGKFIPNLSTLLHPLNALLQAGTKWSWSIKCEEAFREAKKQIATAKDLTHYDPTLPIKLAADASAYGP